MKRRNTLREWAEINQAACKKNDILFWYQYVHQNKEHEVPKANNVPNLKMYNADQKHYFVLDDPHTWILYLNYVWSKVKQFSFHVSTAKLFIFIGSILIHICYF